MLSISSIIDITRYPILDLATPEARSVISDCRTQLAQDGLCLLPGFIRPPMLDIMLAEARRLAPQAHHTEHWRATANGASGDRQSRLVRETRASIGAIAYDQISTESPLRQLYEWDGLTEFISAVLNNDTIYRTDDALVNCLLTVLADNDELGWHYDPNDGVVSLLLQEADGGGEFEFAPNIRATTESDVAELAVLDGNYEPLVRRRLKPGTLSLFNGYRSLHRVAPVFGQQARIIALFNYANKPGYRFSEDIHRRFFGRTIST